MEKSVRERRILNSFCNNQSLPIASASDALKVAKFQKEFRKTN